MSKVDSIKNILLQSDNGLCIAIRGTWGIGKTYLWKQIQEDIEKSTKQQVVYISLFGKEHYSQVLEEIVLQLFRSHNEIAKKASKLISKTINIISSGQITIEAESLFSVLQKKDFNNIIVCFDDIERKSDELKMKYFMGLISQLKDLRDCKVVVILNDAKLQNDEQSTSNENSPKKTANNEDSDYSDYSLYKDKCIDYEFKIESALEVAEHIIENIDFLKDKVFLKEPILDIFKKHFDNNLRSLLRAIEDVQYFYEYCSFDELRDKYEEELFKQAIEIVCEDILLIRIREKEKAKNGTPCLEYYKNNRLLKEEHKVRINEFLQNILLTSIRKLLLLLPNEYLSSNMDDADFAQKIEKYTAKIKNFQINNGWMDFSFYDNIFRQYTNITGKKLEKEETIRKQYIEQHLTEKYSNSAIFKISSIASDIDKIIGGDKKLQDYYELIEQKIMSKKLTLHEWIVNNANITNSFSFPIVEHYNDFSIDEIIKEFNENKKFYEEFFNHYTVATDVIGDEILPENNLFKAYKKFLEQNKNKKQLIIDFLKNNNRKLEKLFDESDLK